MTDLRVSAAICTHGRPEQLRRALASLEAQSPALAEILVVENAPQDGATRALVAREFPNVRYVVEPLPGLNFARNRALRETRGDIVAFLDDDAVAERDWAGAFRKVFEEQPRGGLCTGRVEALALDTPAQRLFEANGGYGRGPSRIVLPRDSGRRLRGARMPLVAWAVSVGTGASMAVRRLTTLQLGGFDEALDLAGVLPGGGDLDLFWRTLEAGFEVIYVPEALAWHEHRRELPDAYRQIVSHQHGVTAFLAKHARLARGWRRVEVITFLAWRLLKPGVRLGLWLLRRDPLPAPLLLRMWWGCWTGPLAYPHGQRIARARRANPPAGRPELSLPSAEPPLRSADR